MSWELAITYPFDDDQWELYHVVEGFSESRNVAAEHFRSGNYVAVLRGGDRARPHA